MDGSGAHEMSAGSAIVLPRRVRGIRDTIPSGYMIGRSSAGNGKPELIPLAKIGRQLQALQLAGGVTVTDGTTTVAQATRIKFNGATVAANGGEADITIASGSSWFGTTLLKPTVSTFTGGFINQGASSAVDSTPGIFFTDPGQASFTLRSLIITTPPATPYSYVIGVINFNRDNNDWVGAGWYDGTNKFQVIVNITGNESIDVFNVTNPTTLSGSAVTSSTFLNGNLIFYKIRDDGTNVTFSYSWDAVNFVQLFTTTKAAGFLGAAGYAHPCITIETQSSVVAGGTFMHFKQGT
jgi:hypothetical protein